MLSDNENRDAKIATNFSSVVDSMANRKILFRFLWLGIGLNVLCWLAVILLPTAIYKSFQVVGNVSDKLMLGLLGIPLIFTTMAVYGLFRLKFPDIEEQKLDSEIMSTFAYQSNSMKRFWIWIGSFSIGIFNTILLILADLALSNAI